MAQSTMSNFFTVKKKNTDFQPSKRLKVQHAVTAEPSVEVQPESKQIPAVVTRTSTRSRKQVQLAADLKTSEAKTVKAPTRAKSKRQTSKAKNQPSIENSLRVTRNSSRSNSPVNFAEDSQVTLKPEAFSELTTAACDDHNVSPPTTPTKRISSNKASTAGKRSRSTKVVRKDILAEIEGIKHVAQTKETEGYDFSKYIKPIESKDGVEETKSKPVSRKKLVMKRRSEENSNEKSAETEDPVVQSSETKQIPLVKETLKSKTKSSDGGQLETTKEKTLKLTMDPAVVKARLAKSGKLAELQERLAQFGAAAAKLKKEKEIQRLSDLKAEKQRANEAAKPKKAPAFERYHTIAAPVPPSLSLPFRYKLLLEMFHSTDTVISMLYKRFEICTFNKLKKAVQVMTRRAFEEKTLGQMKTVYPDAYIFRQEKGILIPGTGEMSSWQLTVEPNLENENSKEAERDKEGRPAFTATRLLDRKSLFHTFLVNIVKLHHKKFLQTLERPLEVPDDKLTRWHPMFRVDDVADVEVADLPQPPNIKTFTTAASVLEQARTKNTVLNARVQKALENMAKQKKESEAKEATSSKPETSDSNKNKKPAATDGIPLSLLERIRAKEAAKDIRAMIIKPEDEKRREMLGRLPSVVNILRTYFVTNKKPSITMEEAIVKVRDSCRSKLCPVEAEAHINLLVQVVPKWITVISIKKGKYIKIDKNQDTKLIIEKINDANKT